MLWRLPRKQFESQKGNGNRKAMKMWCAIALLMLQAAPGLSVVQEAEVRALTPDGGRMAFVCGHGDETDLCVREFAGGAVTRVIASPGEEL